MPFWIRGALIISCALGLTGCDELQEQWIKLRHANTAYIVAACVERNQAAAQRLEMDVRAYCARQHSKIMSIPYDTVSTGGLNCFGIGAYATVETNLFNLNILNPTNWIITQVSIIIRDKQNRSANISRSSDVWIEPGRRHEVTLTLPSKLKCEDFRNSEANEKWTWNYYAISGVSPELR